MTRTVHVIYISVFILITALSLFYLTYNGLSYYRLSQEERFYNSGHNTLKSSGSIGHGLGIAGSLFILIGVGTYMARKRYRSLSGFGLLKYWLEFHIFICILGTILIVFHTAFKVGGLAAVSFWSMITVFVSGIGGRVIYLQIPRSIEGRELDLREIRDMRNTIVSDIKHLYNFDEESITFIANTVENPSGSFAGSRSQNFFQRYLNERSAFGSIKKTLSENNVSKSEKARILNLVNEDIRLGRRIRRLETMQNLFRYWHVFHLPFAILMLIFMIMHVIVTVVLGYKWIF